MNTRANNPSNRIGSGILTAIISILTLLALQFSKADIPDQQPGGFRGIYKVATSTDPAFPRQANQEWFLDFGDGISARKLSGTVAISLRQNPNVRVRILVWQYFPEKGRILIGNQYHEGAKNAVALGDWQLSSASGGIIFERGNHRVVLRRADPADY